MKSAQDKSEGQKRTLSRRDFLKAGATLPLIGISATHPERNQQDTGHQDHCDGYIDEAYQDSGPYANSYDDTTYTDSYDDSGAGSDHTDEGYSDYDDYDDGEHYDSGHDDYTDYTDSSMYTDSYTDHTDSKDGHDDYTDSGAHTDIAAVDSCDTHDDHTDSPTAIGLDNLKGSTSGMGSISLTSTMFGLAGAAIITFIGLRGRGRRHGGDREKKTED